MCKLMELVVSSGLSEADARLWGPFSLVQLTLLFTLDL